jgi:Flp pilus assembly protein TadD
VIKPSGWRWLATVALLVLGIWSKAVGLTGVALLLALVWFFPTGSKASHETNTVRPSRQIWVSWAALAVVCLLAFYPVWRVGKTLVVERRYHGGGLLSTAWLSAKALALYLKHFFLGGELGISYPVGQQGEWVGLLGVLMAVALLALAVVGTWRRGSWSILGLAAVSWWVFFLPVSQLLAPLQNVAADRYMLLPLLPLSLLLAELLARISLPRLRLGLVLLVLLLAAGKTVLQTRSWASSRALYEQALRADPGHTEVMVQLARIAGSEGKLDSAWSWLSRAARIDPHSSQVRMHQALLLHRTGRRGAAIRQLRATAAKDPDADKVRANLALLLAREGPSPEALEWARQAVRIRPLSLHNQRTLGVIALKNNRHDEAEQALSKALRLKPQDVLTLYNMGLLQLRRGNRQLALRFLLRALKWDPGHRASRHLVREIRRGGH